MNKEKLYSTFLKSIHREDIIRDEPMKKHTSFRIGGPADFFITPRTIEQVKEVITLCKDEKIPYYIMGNGSNLLVLDAGFRGVVLQIYKNFSKVQIEDETVTAQAGILLSSLAQRIYEASLTGFEFASGIPGTLGGAVCMNAGAYGGEFKQIIQSATVIDDLGEVQTIENESLKMGYRTSLIQEKGYIVMEAKIKLQEGNPVEIKEIMDDLTSKRTTKQPLELPSAGSTFKRPEGFYAGKLIMDAGLRGYCIGDAQVSEKHCGFIVNKGKATAKDVLDLIQHIQRTVQELFGVWLEPEVRIIGQE